MTAPSLETVQQRFDYGGLPAGLTGDLKRAATLVRELIGDQKKSIIETGRVFLSIRLKLDHGQFLAWAESECTVTPRTVQRYMQVAEMAGKYDIVSHLEPTALYLLAAPSTPAGVRREVFERAAKGEGVRPAQIRRLINNARNPVGTANRTPPETVERSPQAAIPTASAVEATRPALLAALPIDHDDDDGTNDDGYALLIGTYFAAGRKMMERHIDGECVGVDKIYSAALAEFEVSKRPTWLDLMKIMEEAGQAAALRILERLVAEYQAERRTVEADLLAPVKVRS